MYAGVRRDADGDALKARAGERANLVVPIICDVTNNEHITAAVAEITRHLAANDRQLLALVNNAVCYNHNHNHTHNHGFIGCVQCMMNRVIQRPRPWK